jgi:hypothetical protein
VFGGIFHPLLLFLWILFTFIPQYYIPLVLLKKEKGVIVVQSIVLFFPCFLLWVRICRIGFLEGLIDILLLAGLFGVEYIPCLVVFHMGKPCSPFPSLNNIVGGFALKKKGGLDGELEDVY